MSASAAVAVPFPTAKILLIPVGISAGAARRIGFPLAEALCGVNNAQLEAIRVSAPAGTTVTLVGAADTLPRALTVSSDGPPEVATDDTVNHDLVHFVLSGVHSSDLAVLRARVEQTIAECNRSYALFRQQLSKQRTQSGAGSLPHPPVVPQEQPHSL
jgi:hypothetical protein